MVTTTPGFKEAFRQFGEGGWQGLQHPAEFGGQGLPKMIGAACIEMINSANLCFALCPLLTDGAIEALLTAGTREQQAALHPEDDLRRVDRHDEPDRAAGRLRPRAGAHARRAAGRRHATSSSAPRSSSPTASTTWPRTSSTSCWRASPDAPEGVKGISLFIVPKFLVNADGSLGARNDAQCVSASSTSSASRRARPRCCSSATTAAPIGYLVGEENRGLEYMFIMMNAARFAVGMQGIAVAERAYQKAAAFAQGARAVAPGRRLGRRQRDDHPSPRRAPHADDDARLHRRLPRAGDRRRGGVRRRAPRTPTPTRASRTRPSTSSWCRWSRATAPR